VNSNVVKPMNTLKSTLRIGTIEYTGDEFPWTGESSFTQKYWKYRELPTTYWPCGL